jgi:ELWxxDGT repeat protein
MKKLLYLLLSLLCIETGFAQQFPTFDWARVASEEFPAIPSISGGYSSTVRLIKRDAAGNIYIAGDLNKAMVFNGLNIYGQNIYQGDNSYYLMKLNPTGETILWVKSMLCGGINNFAIDTDGFVYVTGAMPDDGTFKYGAATIAGGTTYPNIIPDDAIFFKVNASNGNLVWVKNANNQDNFSNYSLIQTDATAIYATDGLGPNANHSTTPRGYRIIKILKSVADADPDNFIDTKAWVLDKTWVRANIDPLYENWILDMKLTNDKQSLWLYLKTGDAWLDDFSGNLTDNRDMIVVRLDNLNNATPTVGFMKKFSTIICPDQGDLQIDSQGNVLLTGSFGTSPNRYTANINGKADVIFGGVTYEFPMNINKQFIAKLSPTGAETWIKFYDVQNTYQFKSLTLDANDNMYVSGGTVFTGNTTIGSFTSINDVMWVMKLKPDGDQVYMWSNEEGNGFGSDAVLCATGTDGVLIGTGGTQRRLPDAQAYFKVGTKEVFDGGGFVLSNLKHSGTAKPFEELRKLKDINTGSNLQYGNWSSHPNRFTEMAGGLVFFGWMYNSVSLLEEGHLLKTDGTEAGTVSLAKISNKTNSDENSGQSNPFSEESTKTPTHLYFEGNSRNSTTNNFQKDIWKSDGTVAGTIKIKSFDIGSTTIPTGNTNGITPYDIRDIEYCNGVVFFTMTDATNAKIDLWKTDGTEAGTVRLYEGCQSQISSFNNYIYYFIAGAPDSNFGNVQFSLRRHNGTSGNFVKNLAQTTSSNIPRFFGVVNNQLLFVADGTIVLNSNNVNSGMELWKTDGTGAGTVIVKDINPEIPNNFPPGPFSSGKSSITYANESYVKKSTLHKRSIIDNNILYFNADNGTNGRELWKSDGTEAGTVLVKDLAITFTDPYGASYTASSDPAYFYPFNGSIYFMAVNNNNGNRGFFKTDGTTNGTVLVKSDILSSSYNVDAYYNILSAEPAEPIPYAVLNNRLYFAGKETYTPLSSPFNEIWSSDGTTEGTKQLKNLAKVNSTNPVNMYTWNGSLYFTMHKYNNLMNFYYPTVEAELWKFTPAACTNPAPAGPLATVPTILASYPATIKANGCLGIVKWYADASGGSPIFTGDNYTTPLLNTTTTYYLSCTFNNCESQRSPATVTVNQPVCTTLPAVPSSSGGSVVSGNSITLAAIGCTEQTRWYGQASGGAILAQTPTFTTPVLTTPTTYYPVCFVLGCESPRTVLDNIIITPSSGQSLDFDGTDDVVTVPTNIGFNSQNFTMEAWVRFDINNRSQTIMHNDNRYFYYNFAQAGSSIKFGFADNGSAREVGFSFTPTVGNWYHLACTFNNVSKECSFYINGELQDIQTLNYTPSQTNTGMKLGAAFSVTGSELDGRLEEARFWNIARTETQIGASYNTELGGNESGLVFYYKFDGEATCDVQDCSPNQLHGTRTGATGTNNKPQFFNTSVALTNVACGVSSACVPLNPCLSSLPISSPNYTTGANLTRQASANDGLITATNQITNTAKITYQSKTVLLSTGFKAEPTSDGYFKAEIGGCN